MTVTATDVDRAVAATVAVLRPARDADWSVPAGPLTWTYWETVEHLADDLFVYAAQLGPVAPDRPLPFEAAVRTPGGPLDTIRADPAAGVDGLLDVLASCGALLAAMVRTAPPDRRGHHVHGPADAEASAAMGVIETVVHAHDVTTGLGLPWSPDPDVCARVLARLMPDVEPAADPWTTLLWATGRADLPDRPRRLEWRWDNRAGEAERNHFVHPSAPAPGITSEEADRLARELAAQTGESLTDVIVVSLRERLARRRAAGGPATVDRIARLQAQVAEMPVLDDRSHGDVIGYDGHGLPR